MNAKDSPEYYCCWGTLHVKLVTKIIAVCSLVGAIFSLLASVIVHQDLCVHSVFNFSAELGRGVVSGLVLYALKHKKPKLLKPYMVYMAISIVQSIAVFVLGMYHVFEYFDANHLNNEVALITLTILILTIGCAWMIWNFLWYFRIVQSCYRYLVARSATVNV
ncbi:hypothetical protein L596_021006 [Steinernema carpocapsae]|uniref:Uncharacterized protein n=1 Tax=Steinernema carpocapsae TaxID=34508 RepID=A0A4U5MVE7_STECR|nr:hypothetical protein L596_021006 [Steinernema carpocapsae]